MNNRFKFFLKHLLFSFLIVLIVVGLALSIWYPPPLATAVGATQILLIMLTINVVIGPILGMLVYKEGKKTLKFDLSVIIGLQIFALCYGAFTIEQGRPIWLAYNVDRFELIRKNEIIKDNILEALPQYQNNSWFKPKFVAVQFAKDTDTRENDMFAEVLADISIAQKPERYVDFIHATSNIKQRASNLNKLKLYNDDKQVIEILKKYPKANAFIPLQANVLDMVVLICKETGEVIKIVNLRPW
ncbi:TfpX/TfpZ family type IV pilin accessory protein [Acinetobacter lwoffii]|uniref:TfpX/TfpZ family type IV pilin accessory protein n=1 Tax=Acinetobacter lwoffii TaxID=28090 RepID=UPI00209AEAAF|nr:TfpX/TfpZ family type IV pilin accessory protein [Acinetobacter lwoffii]MCO8078545.1 type IV pilin accessory protein [Acinetobacter lwoffii]